MEIDYSAFYELLKGTGLEPWIELLPERIAHGLRYERHGLLQQWEEVLNRLPGAEATSPLPDRGSDVPVAYLAPRKHRTNYFNPQEQTSHLSGNLPHWRQDGCMYFVTFRLADALPAKKLSRLREEKNAWKAEYRRLFEDRIDVWLDAGHGACLLGNTDARKAVERALLHFDGERYRLDAFVVMPNHVHALVAPHKHYVLSDIVKAWKSYTSHELVKRFGVTSPVWQKEYFDHIVRSPESLEKFRNYIAENPKRLICLRDGDVASTNRHHTVEATSPSLNQLNPQKTFVEATSPSLKAKNVELKSGIRIDGPPIEGLEELLKQLRPWRKGPYHVHGVHIDTEWRSDWKWNRVRPHIQPLEGRTVLDVGCGNGYHCWRMAGEGARLAIGVDPSPLYVCQFFAMKHFIRNPCAWVLPLGIEDLPAVPGAFDTVFSMGVLYHRKDPIEHIRQLKSFLRPQGELVIETLVVDGPEGYVLKPEGRYAKMRNVGVIPSVPTLEAWLRQSGLQDVRTVDVSVTSIQEQRATDWMTFESLADFLDPADTSKTIEGHPAPTRAVVVASI